MVPSHAEWRDETDNRATTPVGYCPSTASLSVRPYCQNARRHKCQEYHNCFPFGELEETTRTSSNYVDEDYPARPEIKQSLPGWGDNCGSESSSPETDVCVWRYAPIVVLATQEEEEEGDCAIDKVAQTIAHRQRCAIWRQRSAVSPVVSALRNRSNQRSSRVGSEARCIE